MLKNFRTIATISCVAATACISLSTPAEAALVTYQLKGVTFEDGGTAVGSFRFNSSSPPSPVPSGYVRYDQINVDTSTVGSFLGAPYGPTISSEVFPANVSLYPFTNNGYLDLGFSRALSGTPGEIVPVLNISNEVGGGFASNEVRGNTGMGSSRRRVTSGEVVAEGGVATVPEPSEVLGILALGGIGLASRFQLLSRHQAKAN